MTERTLRMYLHPSTSRTLLSLEGDLTGRWAPELERCWRALSDPSAGEPMSVDVSSLDSIDAGGRRLLDKMRRQGVTVTGLDPKGRGRIAEWLRRKWDGAASGQRVPVLSIPRSRKRG